MSMFHRLQTWRIGRLEAHAMRGSESAIGRLALLEREAEELRKLCEQARGNVAVVKVSGMLNGDRQWARRTV